MMVSPGCGSFPEANWMIFWDVCRNCDTPVQGLWPLGPWRRRGDANVDSSAQNDASALIGLLDVEQK